MESTEKHLGNTGWVDKNLYFGVITLLEVGSPIVILEEGIPDRYYSESERKMRDAAGRTTCDNIHSEDACMMVKVSNFYSPPAQ